MPKPLVPGTLDHARTASELANLPGLFTSFAPGAKRVAREHVYAFPDGAGSLRVSTMDLGLDDMRALLALLALAGPEGETTDDDSTTDNGLAMRALMFQGGKSPEVTLTLSTTYRRLCKELGLSPGSKTFTAIRENILRLDKTKIILRRADGKEVAVPLLVYRGSDTTGGQITLGLSPLLSNAVLGGKHARLELAEVRRLRSSDTASLIHLRLCGWLDHGKTRPIGLPTLMGYAWAQLAEKSSARTMRKKRVYVALEELRGIGWKVREYVKGKFQITRPVLHAVLPPPPPAKPRKPRKSTCVTLPAPLLISAGEYMSTEDSLDGFSN